jgi:hypothetical protein
VDTNILLVDPDVLVRIRQQGGLPFLTNTVLEELDYRKDFHKRANKTVNEADARRDAENARNARLLFREFRSATRTPLTALPTGEPLIQGDVLTRVGFKGEPVFLIGREEFPSDFNNDAKIRALAKDYDMVLITRDNGMIGLAISIGIRVMPWTGPDASGQRHAAREEHRGSGASKHGPQPFAV